MKKVSLLMATLLMLTVSQVNAQEATDGNTGKFALEIQANPLNFTTNVFSIDALRGRYALDNGDNLRVELSFAINANNGKTDLSIPIRDNYSTEAAYQSALDKYNYSRKEYDKVRQGHIGLNVGYEHFLRNDGRLRPYIGGQVGLAKNFISEHILDYTLNPVDNKWYWDEEIYRNCDKTGTTASFVFSLGAFAGVDFYLYEGLYLGAELQATAAWAHNVNYKYITKTDNPGVTVKEVTYKYNGRNGAFLMDYAVTPMLRLGWKF